MMRYMNGELSHLLKYYALRHGREVTRCMLPSDRDSALHTPLPLTLTLTLTLTTDH